MKKPWSITTTLRNPERLRNFLIVLQQLENFEWNLENQKKYQILLIQNRIYGYGSRQFYNGLMQDHVDLVDDPSRDISLEQAEEIFNAKNYEDPAMRGRQSMNPLKKIGLVAIEDNKVKITELGKLFLKDDFDFGEIFFRSFLKWQIPNPDSRDYQDNGDYDIKPFIGTLHLINEVNQKETARGNNAKGISKKELSLFAPTLIHYQSISMYAEKIITLRDELSGKTKQEQKEIFDAYKRRFASDFLETDDEQEIGGLLSNLQDYGDNAIRYFRLTRYIHIRGGGFYVDLEERRKIEIDSLLAYDNAQAKHFESKEDYLAYISDISEPKLPWETAEKYNEIAERLIEEIREYESTLQEDNLEIKSHQEMQVDELRKYITELRVYRRELQNAESHSKSQAIEQVESYINDLENIFDFDDRPILLEKLSALGLHALNDALKIQPNYPVGDDNEPTFTAPANTPDIECFYDSFNAICEVTMLNGRDQWYNEGQPVMRHLRDFEQKHNNKPSYCLFIAPKLHRDTVNTFWTAIKYEYEGQPQRIIPLSIRQFVSVLKVLVQMKSKKRFLQHSEIARLYDEILESSKLFSDSNEWLRNIPNTISVWQESLISQT
ncbi:MAG: AlwI family type II restriction endonuclease [Candidatus Yonathbacteria bacterium]|nr:AlwI family type II restriction endonuclease [Candidatus Yonathbacteria bacterium]NTW47730.1 AlwI family type II restriction endonuclease [Candidatus Yonathbacteria bacterium]